MSVSHRYKNFGAGKAASKQTTGQSDQTEEDQKLAAFEAGYQAGWDDAMKAQAQDKAKVTAEFGQNLMDMSFTYHEAVSKLTSSFQPVMQQIIKKILPETLRSALSAHILEQIAELSKDHLDAPVEIVVAEGNVKSVVDLAGKKLDRPFEVVAEATLGEGQAFVRIGDTERQVDLDGVVAEVNQAMTAFFNELSEEAADDHGKQ
ncbi:MAG: ABC transporter ATP-binding protein [Pseudomonadota bacterium]